MAQEKGVVTGAVPETPVQHIAPVVVQEDKRGFFDKVGDTLGEYVDQGKEFVTDIYDNFSKLDSTDSYKLEGKDLYSQEIIKEANKTPLDRGLEATGDFFKTIGNNFIKPLYESEDSFIKKFTGTDLFRNERSADTANEIIKNFYARDDVQSAKDPNRQAELQRELYDSLKPLIKPEKAESDEQIAKAIDELSISKQQEKYKKEIAEDKLKGIIDSEVQEVINKRFVGGNSFYNQGLIESFKKGAAQELTEVLEMKKDLQISALELGIDKTEVEERIARLDKIIDIKKRQITKGLETAFKDNTAFEEDANGELKIYNKAFEGLSNDEIKTLIDYERNDTKDINTLLNVNRLNQLKKGGVLDRLGAGLSGIQGAIGLGLDTLDTALGIKTLAGGVVGRNYSVDDRESMLNALKSDENYLSMANRVGGAYVLHSALSNFDDIGQVLLGGGIANKVTGVNKVVKFLDGVTGKARSAIATGAKGIIEGYAYNNQLSMSANELNTDDYQAMNAIIDPFAENLLSFVGYMSTSVGGKVGINYFDLGAAKKFKQFMIDKGDESYKTMDIEVIRDQLTATAALIRLNENKELKKEVLKTPESIAEYGRKVIQDIKETGSTLYKGDGLIVTEYSDGIRKASNPGYLFQNAGAIVNKGESYINDLFRHYVDNPDKVIKGLGKEEGEEIKGMIGTVRDRLNNIGKEISLEEKNKNIDEITITGYKIFDKIKGVYGGDSSRVIIKDLTEFKDYLVELDKYGKANLKSVKDFKGNRFMYQESKLSSDNLKTLNNLINGTYTSSDKLATKNVADNLVLNLGLKPEDIGIGTKTGKDTNKILRIEPLSQADGNTKYVLKSDYEGVDVNKIKLIQRGMERAEIIGLLVNTIGYDKLVRTTNDMYEILFGLVPILKDTVFDNVIDLNNFTKAAQLFLSSNKVLGALSGIPDGDKAKALQIMIINAAVKFDGKEKLIGDILRLQDSNEGIVTKAKLITGIFAGMPIKETEIKYFDEVLKRLGVDNLSILMSKGKKEGKKLEKVFNKIEALFGNSNEGKIFRNQYNAINNELINRLYKESLTEDVISKLDPTYINIPKTISEHSKRYKDFIQGIKDSYGLNNRTLGTLLTALKSKKVELEKSGNKDDIKNIDEAINKIEVNYKSKIDVDSRLSQLISNIRNIDTRYTEAGRATKDLVSAKAELMNIMKDIESMNIFDESIAAKLEEVGNALTSKNISIGSDKKDLIEYMKSLTSTIEGMSNGMGMYNNYINEKGEIADYGYTPMVTTIKNVLSYNPEDKLIRYRNLEDDIYDLLKNSKEYNIDIRKIRDNSIDEATFLFNINNTKTGQALINSFTPASMDIEPISVSKMLSELDLVDGLLDKIKVVNNYVYNVQKYLISRGEYNEDDANKLQTIRDYYLYVATNKYIDYFKADDKFGVIEIIKKYKDSGDKDFVKLGEEIFKLMPSLGSKDFFRLAAKFILGKTKDVDFYKAQTEINKKLLNGTPLDFILKRLGFNNPSNLFSDIFDDINKLTSQKKPGNIIMDADGNIVFKYEDTIIKNSTIIDRSRQKILKFLLEKTNEFNKGKYDDKVYEGMTPEQTKEINDALARGDSVEFVKYIRGLTGGVIEVFKGEINNYLLDKLIGFLPEQFTQKITVDFDIQLYKDIIEGAYKTEKGKELLDTIASLFEDKQIKGEDVIIQGSGKGETVTDITTTKKSTIGIINSFLDDIKRSFNDLQTNEYKTDSKKEITDGLINLINSTILDKVEGDVNGTSVKDILIENNDEIMKNVNNSLRSLSEKVGRNIVTYDGLKQRRKPDMVEHSDGINKIFSLKSLHEYGLDFRGKKYDDVFQYEFTESFYNSLNDKNKNLDNSELKTIYTIINNAKYIQNKTGIQSITYNDINWDDVGLGGVKEYISKALFDRIYNNSGKNFIAMPTGGEEASKGFAINPTKEYINNIGTLLLSKRGKDFSGKEIFSLEKGTSIIDLNNAIDDAIFKDVKNVLQLTDDVSKGDFAKRLKGLLAGGTGILRYQQEIVSIMLKDSTLIGMYGIDTAAEKMNGRKNFDKDRVFDILEGKKVEVTNEEIKTIKDLLEEEGYVTDGTIPEKKIPYHELIKDGISEFETNLDKLDDVIIFTKSVKDNIKEAIVNIKNIKNISKQELISKLNEGISNINKYNEGGKLNEFKNLFEKAKKDAESFDKDGKIIPGVSGKSLDDILIEDKEFLRNAYIYTLTRQNENLEILLKTGLKDSNLKEFSDIMADEYGKDSLSVIGKFLVKEPTDGMGYMSRNLAIDIYEDRTFNKFNDNGENDDKLPDLKSHMLGMGVFEKSRQKALTKEFDRHVREKLGLGDDVRFVISFESAVKTGKKEAHGKYDLKDKGTKLKLFGTELEVVGTRKVNSNQLKLASSDAIEDKDLVTLSMQLLASADAVMYQAIQNVSIKEKLSKVLKEGDRFNTNKVMLMDKDRGVHNSVTLNESIKNMETELFNTLKGMSASGSMLKIVGEEKYLNKVVKELPNGKKETVYNYEYTERNTGYVSEYKFKKLLEAGQLKEHPTLKGQYYALGFRNPVPSPYNISVMNIKIDYSMKGKNLKIHPEDTFLKKEGDFDADTVNLITFGKDDFTFKALFLSGLKQTTLDFKHSITFDEAKGETSVLKKRVDEEFDKAMIQLGKQVNEGTFFNKFVPTAQAGEGGEDKSSFAKGTMQGALIESAVAKEKVGVVSVSQEWLYYMLNAVNEFGQTQNETLGGLTLGDMTVGAIADIIDVNADGFYAQFASILQTTLDFAKSKSKFPADWLDKEIISLMKNKDDKEGLAKIKNTIQKFAKNIKRFKNLDIREFKSEKIPDLPPVLRDRYNQINRGLDRIADLKILEGEYDASYEEFFLDKLQNRLNENVSYSYIDKEGKAQQDNIELGTLIKEYFDTKTRMRKDKKEALLLQLLSKSHELYIIHKDFNFSKEGYGRNEIVYDKGSDGYNALYSLFKLNKNKIIGAIESDNYNITFNGKDKITFNYDIQNFNNLQLINLYGDNKGLNHSIADILALKILNYNNVASLSDELKRTDEVLTNVNLLSTLSSKNRKKILESKYKKETGEIEKIEELIKDKFNNEQDYQFITDLTGITSFEELKSFNSQYGIELRSKGENYDVIINKIQKGFIDEVINEIEFKGNLSYSLRSLVNNIEQSYNKGELLTKFTINSEGDIINEKSIDINGDSFIPNTININKELIEQIDNNSSNVSTEVQQYINDVMKYTYRLNPANATSLMKEYSDILAIISNKNSWSIFDKLLRYAPDVATRLTERDILEVNGLEELSEQVNRIRNKHLKGNKEGWVKKIDNSLFRQLARGVSAIDIDIQSDKLTSIEIDELVKYKNDLLSILTKDNVLNKMINKINYNFNNIGGDYDGSYLMDFLGIGKGQHQWVLNEFGFQNKTSNKFENYIKERNPNINEKELQQLIDEVYLLTNKDKLWKFIRFVKSNMYILAFSPILVPAALVVTLLQMVPDFFINISKKSKSFGDPLIDSLIREYKILDSETIRHSKNLHETMDGSVLQMPSRWLGNLLRMASNNPVYKEFVSNIELIASNGFAANDIILGPLRRKVAATRAFDTVIELYGGMDLFKARILGDTEALEKMMKLVRVQSHVNFLDLSGGSSTSKLSQTTIFSSGYHNLWNFMQTWSTSMVNQHIKAASNLHQSVSKLIQGDRTAALGHFKLFSEYLGGQLRMNIAIAAALAKYQIVFNENRNEDGEYDVMSYIKVLNNTYAGLSSFSPLGMATGSFDRLDINNGMMYNIAAVTEEITGRFGREFNLPKNLVQYVSHAIKAGVPPEKIIDGAYDILTDRTNGFMKYNKFELQEGYFQDTYTTNLFGTAMGVNDFTSYQDFKDNIKKYGTQRAFEELSTQGQLAVIGGSNNYIKMIFGIYSDEGSFKVYEQLVKDILEIRNKDQVLRGLISTGINKDALNQIMLNGNNIDVKNTNNLFYDLVSYSAKGLGDQIQSETGLSAFQWNKNPKGANVIDNLVVSQLNEKYGKEIVDAIAQNDYLTISKYIKNKVGPEILKDLVPTGNQSVDEAALRKMLLIAGEKSELSIPTLVSTLIWDKAYDLQQNYGLNKEQAQYNAIQMYGSLANGNLGMVNDVANIYTTKKYKEQLKPLFNNKFNEQFSRSLENKLLIDMAVGRAMYEEGDIESAELRGDMTSIFNKAYLNMKEKNNGVLSKEDAEKLMIDYDYIDTQLNKLNGKVDPLKLFNYREGVFLSMLNKPDMLAEVESNKGSEDKLDKWSDVKDNLTHRFLKFAGERKNYELDSFEDLVKDKYNKEIGLKTSSYGRSGSYGGFAKSSYRPKTSGGGFGGGGQGRPFVERAMNRGIDHTQSPRDLFRNNPYSYVPSMGGPKAYYDDIKIGFEQMYKQMYEQYSKDLVKRNPEYINKIYSIKKMRSENIGMKSKLARTDYTQVPRVRYSQLSKGLIPGWAYKREM